jgi:hypothetical protein
METLHDKSHIHPNKKHIKVDKKNNNNTERPTPIKIYFPSISLNKVNETININPDKRIENKSNKSNKSSTIDISKYLVDESSKIIIYSSTGIFEMLNNMEPS